jgi:hypothetical protein
MIAAALIASPPIAGSGTPAANAAATSALNSAVAPGTTGAPAAWL